MQLSDDQIQKLFTFTEKKFVHWYDLQIELVDHLASKIEEEMAADPSLSFDAGLEKVYKGFGIFGFSRIVQAKHLQIQSAARKMWWGEIRIFFTWPKVALFALILLGLWQLSSFFDSNDLMTFFVYAYILFYAVMLVYILKIRRPTRKLILLEVGTTYSSTTVFAYEVFILLGLDSFTRFSFCITAAIGILIQIATFQLYNKVREKAIILYPQAFA